MNETRYNDLSRNLREYYDKEGSYAMMGVCYDPSTKEHNGLLCPGLAKDPKKIKELESLGYIVVKTAPLEADVVNRMNEQERYSYEEKLNHVLVIDKNEKPSLYLEQIIAERYFGAEIVPSIAGVGIDTNSVTRSANRYGYTLDSINGLESILRDVGFQTEMDDRGNLTTSSNIPYPTAKTSKWAQIYAGMKGKIKEALAKLKAAVKPKEQEKDKDQGRE